MAELLHPHRKTTNTDGPSPGTGVAPVVRVRGAIFDMDGILVDSEPAHAAAYVSAFAQAGLSLTLEEYRAWVTLGGGSIRDLFRARGGDPAGWEPLFAAKCEQFGRHVTEELTLLPGVLELLVALEQRGVPRVLATGAGRWNAEIILGHFGLSRFFRAVLTGDDVRRAKPDPEVFFLAAATLGLPPEECLSFEDSPKGVRAAAAAGVPCIAIPTRWTREGDFSRAYRVLGSLREMIPSLLDELCSQGETK